MKRLVLIVVATLVLVTNAPTGFAQTDSLKIGVVDLARVIQEYERFQQATDKLAAEVSRIGQELNELTAETRPLSEEMEQLRRQMRTPGLDEDVRKQIGGQHFALMRKIAELSAPTAETRKTLRARLKELASRKQKMVEATTDEILEAIREKARQEHYSLVLEKTALGTTKYSGLSTPVLIYADKTLDMTDDVIAMLNQPPAE